MPPRDPTNEVVPDYEGAEWDTTRLAIMAAGNTAEQAVAILRADWENAHQRALVAWNDHVQQLREEENQGEPARVGPQPRDPTPGANGGRPEWRQRPTPRHLDITPSRRILAKLEKKEFVWLWHFTGAGCREDAAVDLAAPEDTFSLVDTGSGLALQSTGATATSKKIIHDKDLDHGQWTEGKDRMLACMERYGWDEDEVEELALFFHRLDKHPLKSEEYGQKAILLYQEQVRHDWTEARRLDRDAYAISEISESILLDCHRKVINDAQIKANKKLWEIIRDQERTEGAHSRQPRSRDYKQLRGKQSHSRSPIRRPPHSRRRSRSPDHPRNSSFRPNSNNYESQGKLPACPICLSRHKHQISTCYATHTWDGRPSRCHRLSKGRIANSRRVTLCSDWQRPNRCDDKSSDHVHECSGCGASNHGADGCPNAQP